MLCNLTASFSSSNLTVPFCVYLCFPKDDIGKLGKLLMHDSFNVWTVHKDRYKMKDLIRFKPSQRQIYLFEQGIVFCKIQMEPSDQGLCPHYSFKKSVKVKVSYCAWESAQPCGEKYFYLYLIDKETEAWRGEVNLSDTTNRVRIHPGLIPESELIVSH